VQQRSAAACCRNYLLCRNYSLSRPPRLSRRLLSVAPPEPLSPFALSMGNQVAQSASATLEQFRPIPATLTTAAASGPSAKTNNKNASGDTGFASKTRSSAARGSSAGVSPVTLTPAAASGPTASPRSGNVAQRAHVTPTPTSPAKRKERKKKNGVSLRNSVSRAKTCVHGKRATRCPACIKQAQAKSGTYRSLCPHLKQKGWCLECKKGGSSYYGDSS
jgi:hypothetical protein